MATRRPYGILALMALTLFLASGTGFPLYFRLFLLIALVMAGSLAWAFLNLEGVSVKAQRGSGRLQVGESLESRVSAHSSSLLPKFGIEISDLSELPGHDTSAVVNLAPHQDLPLMWRTPLRRRGIYRVGAPIVYSRDPFGLFRLRHREPEYQQLVVFPRMVDIPPFSPPQSDTSGEGVVQRSTPIATTSVATVREYQAGESARHIHWPSTARKANLVLKQFDSDLEDQAWILLDLQSAVQAGEQVENTEEYAISAAASIARNYSERGWAVGLLAHGDRQYVLPPQEGIPTLDRILLALTEARAQGRVPLTDILSFWRSQMASFAVSLVVVTPSVDPGWSLLLEALVQQGVSPAAVIVDPQSFGARADPRLLLSRLQRRRVSTYMLRKGEDISRALQQPYHLSPARESSGAVT